MLIFIGLLAKQEIRKRTLILSQSILRIGIIIPTLQIKRTFLFAVQSLEETRCCSGFIHVQMRITLVENASIFMLTKELSRLHLIELLQRLLEFPLLGIQHA